MSFEKGTFFVPPLLHIDAPVDCVTFGILQCRWGSKTRMAGLLGVLTVLSVYADMLSFDSSRHHHLLLTSVAISVRYPSPHFSAHCHCN